MARYRIAKTVWSQKADEFGLKLDTVVPPKLCGSVSTRQ